MGGGEGNSTFPAVPGGRSLEGKEVFFPEGKKKDLIQYCIMEGKKRGKGAGRGGTGRCLRFCSAEGGRGGSFFFCICLWGGRGGKKNRHKGREEFSVLPGEKGDVRFDVSCGERGKKRGGEKTNEKKEEKGAFFLFQ